LYELIFSEIEKINEKLIDNQRKRMLEPLIDYISFNVSNQKKINLNFICTHNSRRSVFAQVWAQAMAKYYNFTNVFCYSGGTESTSIYYEVINAIKKFGFEVNVTEDNDNPVYLIKYSLNQLPVIAFSKSFDHPLNPKSNFAAILTCSDADQRCPIIKGADIRIPMTFEDPKGYDNTNKQNEKYLERGLDIATELKYVFSKIKIKS